MAMINTVAGSIRPEELGVTLMHEHILGVNTAFSNAFPDWFDREGFIRHACKIIDHAKAFGARTIVDQSTIDMDRKIDLIKELSERAQINIIVATGLYGNNSHIMVKLAKEQPDYLAGLMIREIEQGIAKTGVKAGWIKCATYKSGLDENNLAILKVMAKVHKATGVTIGTHSEAHTGLDQQDVFEAEGVDLSRVLIGHVHDTDDLDYMKKLVGRGSTIGMDRFGINTIQSEATRARLLIEMVKAGYGAQLALSHDYIIWGDLLDSVPVHGRHWKDVDWDWLLGHEVQFSYLFTNILPICRAQGISEADIKTMLVDVPARLLTPVQ